MSDRETIHDLLAHLTGAEQKMLPDVQATADALLARIVSLNAALGRLEPQLGGERLSSLSERIAELERQSADVHSRADRERLLTLLRRQRDQLAELAQSRARLLEQYESGGLLLQNLALDLLKVRSSGLDAAIGGITSATQEARALSREIGYVLAAADELREIETKR